MNNKTTTTTTTTSAKKKVVWATTGVGSFKRQHESRPRPTKTTSSISLRDEIFRTTPNVPDHGPSAKVKRHKKKVTKEDYFVEEIVSFARAEDNKWKAYVVWKKPSTYAELTKQYQKNWADSWVPLHCFTSHSSIKLAASCVLKWHQAAIDYEKDIQKKQSVKLDPRALSKTDAVSLMKHLKVRDKEISQKKGLVQKIDSEEEAYYESDGDSGSDDSDESLDWSDKDYAWAFSDDEE